VPPAATVSAFAHCRLNCIQVGDQYTSSDTELGGPWVCPTDPQYTNTSSGSCDPCGENRPNPYWGTHK